MTTQSDKSLVLYSVPTPNGATVSIFLEELKEAYGGPDYEPISMSIRDADIGKAHNQVKSDWFTSGINPNGRIPAITHNGFSVFETSAILLYLAAEFDQGRKFSADARASGKEGKEAYSRELQWLFFAHGGVGPMQGQAGHFLNASEKIPYAINRYKEETKRLYSVLEARLNASPYLAGETYGIADIKTFGWVRAAPRVEIDLTAFPKLDAWVKTIAERPAVKRGVTIPAWPQ